MKIKLNRAQWEKIGHAAKWLKKAQFDPISPAEVAHENSREDAMSHAVDEAHDKVTKLYLEEALESAQSNVDYCLAGLIGKTAEQAIAFLEDEGEFGAKLFQEIKEIELYEDDGTPEGHAKFIAAVNDFLKPENLKGHAVDFMDEKEEAALADKVALHEFTEGYYENEAEQNNPYGVRGLSRSDF